MSPIRPKDLRRADHEVALRLADILAQVDLEPVEGECSLVLPEGWLRDTARLCGLIPYTTREGLLAFRERPHRKRTT